MADGMDDVRMIKYILLQTTIGPSIICDIFVFIYFIRHWKQSIINTPHNHVIFCLLIITFMQKLTDVLSYLYFLRWNILIIETANFCLFWTWANYSLTITALILLAWCCIERNLFVFHNQLMKKTWCLILFHYIPLLICLIYPQIFYITMIFFPTQCINVWDYTNIYCGGACYVYVKDLMSFDWFFNNCSPIFTIVIFNGILFSRFIWKKIRQQRLIEWRRQRRLIIQLIFISSLYLLFGGPAIIVGIIQTLWLPTFLLDIQFIYLYYLTNYINQLYPFVIVSSLPEMKKELRQWIRYIKIFFCRQTQIRPFQTTTVHLNTMNSSVRRNF